jgi:hypothetical protein
MKPSAQKRGNLSSFVANTAYHFSDLGKDKQFALTTPLWCSFLEQMPVISKKGIQEMR